MFSGDMVENVGGSCSFFRRRFFPTAFLRQRDGLKGSLRSEGGGSCDFYQNGFTLLYPKPSTLPKGEGWVKGSMLKMKAGCLRLLSGSELFHADRHLHPARAESELDTSVDKLFDEW
ncbi:hypothetical protein Tco_0799418 [Tanacetum coccineum]|uniref:Uncharacterized protein n=1 Tax=Tanacetum coccineum TaxID=301880 RepID=A0ABQ4ZR98_9ASTR